MLPKLPGFTLLELLVTLTIAGILNAMVAPYFTEFVSSLRTYNAAHSLRVALVTARSEALKRNSPVRICPSRDGITCDSTYYWEQGWISYQSSAWSTGRADGNPVIHQGMALEGATIFKKSSGITVLFDRNGRIGQNCSFHICDSRSGEPVLKIVLYRTGRIRVTTTGINCSAFIPQLLDQKSLYA